MFVFLKTVFAVLFTAMLSFNSYCDETQLPIPWRVEKIAQAPMRHLFSLTVGFEESGYSFYLAESNQEGGLREILLVDEQHDWWGCLAITTNGIKNIALSTLSSNNFEKCFDAFLFCRGSENDKVDFAISQRVKANHFFAEVALRNRPLFKVYDSFNETIRPEGKSLPHRFIIIPVCQEQNAMLINNESRGKYYDVACIICGGNDTYNEDGYMITSSGVWKRYKSHLNADGTITSTIINENEEE